MAVVALSLAIGLRSFLLSQEIAGARSRLIDAMTTAQLAGLGLTLSDTDRITADLQATDRALARATDSLKHDPLIGLARELPWVNTQFGAVQTMTTAGRDLTSHSEDVRVLLQGFIAARDTGKGTARLAALVRFVHDQGSRIGRLAAAFDDADKLMSGLAASALWQPVGRERDLLVGQLNAARPLVAAAKAAPIITAALGAGGEKRYLLLALDSAEIRPMGGLIAAFATPRLTNGLLHDFGFRDVLSVDHPHQKQYVLPPAPLSDHLLGGATWQMADAGWWPDFARSAAEARRLYRIETGDANLQGAIAFTPEFVDGLLRLVGPVLIPRTGITVHSGETYLVSLEQVEVLHRGASRKQFLADLASAVLDRLFALPPTSYSAMWSAIDDAGKRRHLLLALDDPDAQALVTGLGWYSPFIFPSAGDRLAVMEANVAPVSKLDVLLDLRHELSVALQPDGSAQERLVTTFTNRFGLQLPDALRSVRSSFFSGHLGSYQRRYLRPDANVLSVTSDDPKVPITDPDSLEVEFGSLAVGNYQLVGPGTLHLETTYTVPSVVTAANANPAAAGIYSLHFIKQPGRDRDMLIVHVTVPTGTIPTQWSAGGIRGGSTVTFSMTTEFDRTLTVRYRTR